MRESDSKPNPFDQGEWVLLQPEGYGTYDFQGRSSTSTCRVRRSQILAVDKVFLLSGKVCVEIAIAGSVHPRVLFDPSPEGKRDADLLVEACLTPTQRMVEVQGPYERKGRVMVAIDTIKMAARADDNGMRVYLWIESGGTGPLGSRDQYRRDFETEQQVMEFLKLCGAKVE